MTRARWRRTLVAAALFGFLVALFTAGASQAAPYTFNLTGTVTDAGGFFSSALGITAGDTLKGSFSFPDLNTDTFFPELEPSGFTLNEFPQGNSMSWDIQVGHPGTSDLSLSGTTTYNFFAIDTLYYGPKYGTSSLQFIAFGGGLSPGGFGLTFDVPGNHVLTSLAGLPGNAYDIIALLGGTGTAKGTFTAPGNGGTLAFNIALTPTPIPASLPLFVSALFGLGIAGWRRRSASPLVEDR